MLALQVCLLVSIGYELYRHSCTTTKMLFLALLFLFVCISLSAHIDSTLLKTCNYLDTAFWLSPYFLFASYLASLLVLLDGASLALEMPASFRCWHREVWGEQYLSCFHWLCSGHMALFSRWSQSFIK